MKVLLKQDQIEGLLQTMAEQILRRRQDAEQLALIGIRQGGVYPVDRLQALLEKKSGHKIKKGLIDINLYRDDIGLRREQPMVRATEINFPLDGKRVILVDDVLFTGRTIRAALSALIDLGRPSKVELAVLIDRGHRELPIAADYVGRNVETTSQQNVELRQGPDGAWQVVVKDAA